MNYYTCITTAKRVSDSIGVCIPIHAIIGSIGYYIDVDCNTDIKSPVCYAFDSDGYANVVDDSPVNEFIENEKMLKEASWEYDLDIPAIMSRISFDLVRVNKCLDYINKKGSCMPFYHGVRVLTDASDILSCVIRMQCEERVVAVSRASFRCLYIGDDGKEESSLCPPDMDMVPIDFWDTCKDDFIRCKYCIHDSDINNLLEMLNDTKKKLDLAFDRLLSVSRRNYKVHSI